jgi:hypothetical protein
MKGSQMSNITETKRDKKHNRKSKNSRNGNVAQETAKKRKIQYSQEKS